MEVGLVEAQDIVGVVRQVQRDVTSAPPAPHHGHAVRQQLTVTAVVVPRRLRPVVPAHAGGHIVQSHVHAALLLICGEEKGEGGRQEE